MSASKTASGAVFGHYATGCELRIETDSDGAKTRKSGGRTLSSRRTAPLKPKPGLSGPPVHRVLSDPFAASSK